MSEGNFELAQKLAARPYFIMWSLDETTEGKPIFVARTLEIKNCFGQGNTSKEAETDLRGALVDFIEGLLEDGLTVPEPAHLVKTQKTGVSATVNLSNQATQKNYISIQDSYVLNVGV